MLRLLHTVHGLFLFLYLITFNQSANLFTQWQRWRPEEKQKGEEEQKGEEKEEREEEEAAQERVVFWLGVWLWP